MPGSVAVGAHARDEGHCLRGDGDDLLPWDLGEMAGHLGTVGHQGVEGHRLGGRHSLVAVGHAASVGSPGAQGNAY